MLRAPPGCVGTTLSLDIGRIDPGCNCFMQFLQHVKLPNYTNSFLSGSRVQWLGGRMNRWELSLRLTPAVTLTLYKLSMTVDLHGC